MQICIQITSFSAVGTGSAKKPVSSKKPVSAKKPVPPKKTENRKYVTTHELQQKQQQMKLSRKSPDLGRRRSLRLSPNLLTSQPDASAMNTKGIVRRKLDLHIDSSGEECSEQNDPVTEVIFYLCIYFLLVNYCTFFLLVPVSCVS